MVTKDLFGRPVLDARIVLGPLDFVRLLRIMSGHALPGHRLGAVLHDGDLHLFSRRAVQPIDPAVDVQKKQPLALRLNFLRHRLVRLEREFLGDVVGLFFERLEFFFERRDLIASVRLGFFESGGRLVARFF